MKLLHVLMCASIGAFSSLGTAQKSGAEAVDVLASKAAESPKADMKRMNKLVRTIGRFLKKPDPKAAPMAEVDQLQACILAAKVKLPSLAKTKPEAERPAFVKGYRMQMNTLLRQSLDLEEAMVAEKWEAAGKALKAMNGEKSSGHKKYKGRARRRKK